MHAFVTKHGGSFRVDRLAYVADIKWKGKQIVCICPTTFMNLSGKAFQYWLDKEKVLIENTLTVVDDLALPIDKIRLRKAGTHAGHNGLKDIQAILDSDAYAKLRFGIGDNYPKGMQADFVLSKWLKTEEPTIKLKIETCIEIIENFIIVGIDQTMSKYNNLVINP